MRQRHRSSNPLKILWLSAASFPFAGTEQVVDPFDPRSRSQVASSTSNHSSPTAASSLNNIDCDDDEFEVNTPFGFGFVR